MKKGYKECPYCANTIKESALKCQYCWEFLNKTTDDIKSEHNKTSIPLYVKIIIGFVIFIFWVILISNKSNSSDVISYNNAIIEYASDCYNTLDNIPDNPWDYSYTKLHQIIVNGKSTCESSKSNIISLWWWKWDFRLEEAAEDFTTLIISFFNECDDFILYLYPDTWKDTSNLEKDTELLRSLWNDVDDAWGRIVDTQKDFAKEYNYRLE